MEYEIKKKGNKTRNIIVFSIIALLLITLGVSYAMYSKSVSSHDTKVIAGDIYMRYINGETKAISMIPSDTYNEDDYYEFTISGKNTSNKDIIYDIKLNHGENYNNPYIRLDDKYLRFRLVTVNNGEETEVIKKTGYDDIENKTIHVETIDGSNDINSEDVNTTYRLYTWVEGVIVGNVNQTYTSDQWSKVYTNIKVSVTGDFVDKEKSNTVIVTFDSNGGVVNPTSKVYSLSETTYGELPIPIKEGYTFEGWYKENTFENKITSDTEIEDIDNITLYANFVENDTEYTISYSLDGGTTTNVTTFTPGTESFTLSEPIKEGYTFIGWTEPNSDEKKMNITIEKGTIGNKTYTANWTLTEYTIIYDLDEGTADNPNSYTIESETFTLNNPTKIGYNFTGWTGSNGNTPNINVSIEKGSTGDKSYKANYVVDAIHDVTFTSIAPNIYTGSTLNTTNTLLEYSGTAKTISYSSSNTGIAVVSPEGVISAINSGTAVITATITDYENTVTTATLNINVITVWAENLSYEAPNGITCANGVNCDNVQLILDKIAGMIK